jgi:site-specific recombinase XerD
MKNQVKNWKTLLDNFFFISQVNGKTTKTIEWYKYTLIPFTKNVPLEDLNVYSVLKYISYLRERGLKPSAIDSNIRAIKTFLKFLYEEGYLEENISAKIKKIKLPKQYPYVLNDEQVYSLLKACDKKTWTGIRDYVMILTFLDTGIRLSELINLTINDINLTKRSIFIRNGKGGKDREVYMGKTLVREIAKWLKVRGFIPYEERLFVSRDGLPLKARNIQKIIKRLAKKAGITGVRCSPHTLRHTFATNFIRNGGDVFTLQKILGHADITTCMVYVHMGGRQIQEAMMKFSPVDRMERY